MNSEPSTLNGSPDLLIGERTPASETNEMSSPQLTSSMTESIPMTRADITQSESTLNHYYHSLSEWNSPHGSRRRSQGVADCVQSAL